MRISPPRIIPEALPAPKPAAGAPGADAFRQTSFVLGGEVEAILAGLNVEGAIAAASAGAKFRTTFMAGALLQWSQGWLCRLQALHAVQHGNYAAAFPLVDRAFDYSDACGAVLDDASAWAAWLDRGVSAAPADHGTRIRLEPAPAARGGHAERARAFAAALARPDFGAALLVAAGESGPDRLVATFGDRDFHVGLAELALGLLAVAGIEQLRQVTRDGGPFAVPEDASPAAAIAGLERVTGRADRCAAEQLPGRADGAQFAIRHWRRSPGGAPKRLVL